MAKAPVARLVVLGQVVHQNPADQPSQPYDARWVRLLVSEDQPYLRTLTIGEEWTPLDTGWVKGAVAQLVVANREGRFAVNPTPEERAEVEARVVELGIGAVPFAAVHPGEDCRFEPCGGVSLRCRRGRARVSTVVVPA